MHDELTSEIVRFVEEYFNIQDSSQSDSIRIFEYKEGNSSGTLTMRAPMTGFGDYRFELGITFSQGFKDPEDYGSNPFGERMSQKYAEIVDEVAGNTDIPEMKGLNLESTGNTGPEIEVIAEGTYDPKTEEDPEKLVAALSNIGSAADYYHDRIIESIS